MGYVIIYSVGDAFSDVDKDVLTEASVPCDYAKALQEKFGMNGAAIKKLWKAGVPLDYLIGIFSDVYCLDTSATIYIDAYMNGVAAGDIICGTYKDGVAAEDINCD